MADASDVIQSQITNHQAPTGQKQPSSKASRRSKSRIRNTNFFVTASVADPSPDQSDRASVRYPRQKQPEKQVEDQADK